MRSVKKILKQYGAKIVWDLRKGARPNKKTGTLDKSISYKVSGKGTKNQLLISQVYYGKYLNAHTGYIDKVANKRLEELADKVAEAYVEDILEKLIKLE